MRRRRRRRRNQNIYRVRHENEARHHIHLRGALISVSRDIHRISSRHIGRHHDRLRITARRPKIIATTRRYKLCGLLVLLIDLSGHDDHVPCGDSLLTRSKIGNDNLIFSRDRLLHPNRWAIYREQDIVSIPLIPERATCARHICTQRDRILGRSIHAIVQIIILQGRGVSYVNYLHLIGVLLEIERVITNIVNRNGAISISGRIIKHQWITRISIIADIPNIFRTARTLNNRLRLVFGSQSDRIDSTNDHRHLRGIVEGSVLVTYSQHIRCRLFWRHLHRTRR